MHSRTRATKSVPLWDLRDKGVCGLKKLSLQWPCHKCPQTARRPRRRANFSSSKASRSQRRLCCAPRRNIMQSSSRFSATASIASMLMDANAAYMYLDPALIMPMARKPPPGSNSSAISYTFGPGPLGLTLDNAHGGTRIVVSEVANASQAQHLGVPVGGILMEINGRTATGRRLAHIGQWLATEERPLTLRILHPGGAAAVAAVGIDSKDESIIEEFAIPAPSAMLKPPKGEQHHLDASREVSGTKPQTKGEQHQLEPSRAASSTANSNASVDSAAVGASTGNSALGDGSKSTRKHKAKHKKGTSTSRDVAAAEKRPERPPLPKAFRYTFGPGPLGLGLSDNPNGAGVAVTEVIPGSAASEQGIMAGGLVLQLNGMDVTNQGKVGLSKMIGYIPRPLTITLSAPIEKDDGKKQTEANPAPAATHADASVASDPTAKGQKAAKPAPKSGPPIPNTQPDEEPKSVQLLIDDAEPGPGTVQAAKVVTEAKAGSAVAAGAHAKNGGFIKDGVSTDGGLDTDVIAVDASDGNDEDTSDGVIPPVALPTGAELPSIAVKSPPPKFAEAKLQAEKSRQAVLPKRAHPPPQAPIDAWPPWATTPPPRSPRTVVGGEGKYTLKRTEESFNHSSLSGTFGKEG